jgi:hypothetical protein
MSRSIAVAATFLGIGIVGAASVSYAAVSPASAICFVCYNDFDTPPPSASNCSMYGFLPFCSGCVFEDMDPDCKEDGCNTEAYWEEPYYCGEMCPLDAPACQPNYTLDGTADEVQRPMAIAGDKPQTSDVLEEEGVIYHYGCDGSVVGRIYSPEKAARVTQNLSVLRL